MVKILILIQIAIDSVFGNVCEAWATGCLYWDGDGELKNECVQCHSDYFMSSKGWSSVS